MASEEDPFCNWCRLSVIAKRYGPEDVTLVPIAGNYIGVFVREDEVMAVSQLPIVCLCGQDL